MKVVKKTVSLSAAADKEIRKLLSKRILDGFDETYSSIVNHLVLAGSKHTKILPGQ